jgi:hypothetical protein
MNGSTHERVGTIDFTAWISCAGVFLHTACGTDTSLLSQLTFSALSAPLATISLRPSVASLNWLWYDGWTVNYLGPGSMQGGRRRFHSVTGSVGYILFSRVPRVHVQDCSGLVSLVSYDVDPFLQALLPGLTSKRDVESEKNSRWSPLILPRL